MNLFDTLIEQYNLHKEDKVYYSIKHHNKEDNNITPVFEHTKYFNKDYTEDWVIKTLGRKWKHNIANLMSFIDIYKYVTDNPNNHEGYIKPIPISCNSSIMKEIYGNHRNVSKVIRLACKVELLKVVNDSYQYNAYKDYLNTCKSYILNKQIQTIIIQLSSKYSITYSKFIHRNIIYNSGTIRLQ